jgi:hypothetical protein
MGRARRRAERVIGNPSFTGAASIRIPTRHASYQRQRRWKSSISRGDFSVHDFLTSGVARHKGGIGLPRLGRPHQSAPTAPGGRGDDGPQPGLHGVDRDGAGRLEDRAHDAALGGGHGSDARAVVEAVRGAAPPVSAPAALEMATLDGNLPRSPRRGLRGRALANVGVGFAN